MNATRLGLLPMGVVNLDFLVHRLGQDCSLNQYLREQTQNAIEAIQRTGRPDGHIIWDHFSTDDGVRKLCIVDNGDGMTGPEMLKYINNLSCSRSEQDMSGNYGIGAKIAGATHSPEGLVYISKPDHDPDNGTYMVQLMRAEGKYGLTPFGDEGGYEYYAEYPEDQWHEHFKTYGSGTQVVILGKTADADTAAGPSAQWVSQYLNRRYFTIPKGIKIQCREAKKPKKTEEDFDFEDEKNGLRPVRGQKWLLDGVALHKGVVELATARAYWWIVPEDEHQFNPPLRLEGAPKPIRAMKSFHYSYNTKGHVGIIYQGELYDVRTGVPGYHVVQTFGVLLGASRVAIYIEPTSGALTTDTARTRININKEDAPWEDWAAEFKTKMPQDLADFIESFDEGTKSNLDELKAIRAKFQEMLPLYNLDRYRKDPKGDKELDADSDRGLPSPLPPYTPHNTVPNSHPGSKPPKPLFGKLKPGGTKGNLIRIEDIPEVQFLYGSEAKELMGPTIAAHYVHSSLIQANGDFCIFQQLIEYFVAQYQDQPGTRSKITQFLEHWVKIIIIDITLSMRTLTLSSQGFVPWASSSLDRILRDDEAFTMALAPRMLLTSTLKREIYRELGKPAAETDARTT